MKAACFSVATVDYFPQQAQFSPGGNALNQTINLSNLGMSTSFVGALGRDQHGKKLYSLLVDNKVDVSQLSFVTGMTANNQIVNDENGERFGLEDAWQGGVFEKYRIPENSWEYIKSFELWATHSSCPNFPETLVRKRNNILCVDYLHLPDLTILQDTIEYVDIAYVGGDESMKDDLEKLSIERNKLVVLTLGANGSIAFHCGKRYTQQALETTLLDTTGCGDAFQAGFTNDYMRYRNIEKALLSGAKLAQKATGHYGGASW